MKEICGGKYVTEEDFGEMSVVKATNTKTGETVALKRMPADRKSEGTAELSVWKNVYGEDYRRSFEENGWLYIERKWIEGVTLAEYMEDTMPFDEECASYMFAEIVYEVVELQDKTGCAHGDIKPDNIIVTGGGVRLIDFESTGQGDNEKTGKNVFKTIKFITPGFSAPEKITGKCGFESDIYSLGMIFLFLIGKRSENISCDEMPAFYPIIKRCLEDRPEDRFKNARELYDSLMAVIMQKENKPENQETEVLFQNKSFGYRRLIIYVRGVMAFAAELAFGFAEKGFETGLCEICDSGLGTVKYYIGERKETGKPEKNEYDYDIACEETAEYDVGPKTATEDIMLEGLAKKASAVNNLSFETKKLKADNTLDTMLMRDFIVRCYTDFDVTVVCDMTTKNEDNKAQLIRFSDYAVFPLDANVDTFEDGFIRASSFLVENAIPLKRLCVVGWDYSEDASADESLLKVVAGSHYIGAVGNDKKRKTSLNIFGGYYAEKMPEKIKKQYSLIIDKIVKGELKSA